MHYQFDPVQTTKTSVHGAINVLGIAKRVKARILQASTSEVYGDPEIHPQPESYWGRVNPIGPRACYDEAKRCAETLIFDYYRQYQIPIRVVRIFDTYGPHMHPNDGRVVSNFIVQALRNEDITVYGDGGQTRSFLLELAKLVLKLIPGSRSRVVYKELPADDPRQRKPDITLAQEILDWTPETELEEGLRHTIAYFRELIADPERSRG